MKRLPLQLECLIAKFLIKVENIILDFVRVLLFKKKLQSPQSARSILVFRSSGLGDFICVLPALRLLKKHFPNTKIILLTIPSSHKKWRNKIIPGGMIFGNHLVDETIVIAGNKLKNWKTLKTIRSTIRSYRPDLCVILPFSGEGFSGRVKKMIYLKILGVEDSIYGTRFESTLSFFRRCQFSEGKFEHQILAALKTLREIGIKDQEIVFDIEISMQDKKIVDDWCNRHNLKDKTPIAIHPGSNHKVKQWPIENFKILGEMILDFNREINILLVGGQEDKGLGDFLVKCWGEGAVNFAGKTTFLQTAAILRRCKLFIGNDSGPMHLAAALGIPVIGIFSSITFPVFWAPWGEHSKMIRHSVPCEYCFADDGNCPTGTYECIRGISVKEVFNACLSFIETNNILPRT